MNKRILFMIFSFLSVFFIEINCVKAEDKIINLDYDSQKLKSYLSSNQNRLSELDNYWNNQMPYTDDNGNTYNNYAIIFRSYNTKENSLTNNAPLERYEVFLYNGDNLYLNSYYRKDYFNDIHISNKKNERSSGLFDGNLLIYAYENDDIDTLTITDENSSPNSWSISLTYYADLYYGNVNFPVNYFSDFFTDKWSATDVNFEFVYSTNSNFKLYKNSYSFDFKYNDNVLTNDSDIPTVKEFFKIESIPKITFTTKNNTEEIDGEEYITSKDLTVDFGYIDNTKYIYQISLDDGENWQTYTLTQSTSTTLEITNNLTVIARVLKIEDNSLITSSTYKITGIKNSNFVTLSDYSSSTDYCFETIDGKKYQVCFNLIATFSKVDNNKYNYFISDEKGSNFSKITDMENTTSSYIKSFNLFKNGNYIVKIEDKNGNYINSSTITLNFAKEVEELGQKITFSTEYDKDDGIVNLFLLFLNVDVTKYNYFYSVDMGRNWININDFVKNGDFYKYKTQENITFIAKVEDKNGNYVTSSTMHIDMSNYIDDDNPLKEIFSFFKNQILNKFTIIQQIGDIINSFRYLDGYDNPPTFTFNLDFMKAGIYTFTLDFEPYRAKFFGFVKIIFACYTIFSLLNEIKNLFGGGN